MDLLDDDGSSSSSDAEMPRYVAGGANVRLSLDVGQRQPLPDIAGQCLGDDMTWKGSKTLRIASVQCGSTGRDRFQWLCHGQGLRALKTNIGILSETALQGDAQHGQACRGLQSCGSGVILAVRSGYSGCWTDVAKDPSGRAISAVLHTSSGIDVRCLALYGPVGACLPQFGVGNPRHSEVEQALKRATAAACSRRRPKFLCGC